MYKLLPAQDENLLFFRLDGETAVRYGAVGYLRADFGKDGRAFFTTWFNSQTHLNTSGFKKEFEHVIYSLSDGGSEPPFASRGNLEAFCAATPGKELTTRGSGYMVQTQEYSYYFRCKPSPTDYDIFCFAYDNRWLLPELAGQHDTPNGCYSLLPSTGEIILIRRGERSYTPIAHQMGTREDNRLFVDAKNAENNITRAQEEAMLAGSLLGWDTPAAKPWNYDQNGNPWPMPPKRDAPGR